MPTVWSHQRPRLDQIEQSLDRMNAAEAKSGAGLRIEGRGLSARAFSTPHPGPLPIRCEEGGEFDAVGNHGDGLREAGVAKIRHLGERSRVQHMGRSQITTLV